MQRRSFLAHQRCDPKNTEALISIGEVYYSQGNIEAAKDIFKQVLLINPVHPAKEQLLEVILSKNNAPLDENT